ncbi:MAG: TolC family protein [Acidobacteria bacterium]|nr:TolC family protein [Acidobacteriota bacterium]
MPTRCPSAFLLLTLPVYGQLTLTQAVEEAARKYPAVQAQIEQVSAAAAGINLARASYLPRADFTAQLNRATHNNVFGMVLAPFAFSPISGPVLRTNSLGNVWGSLAGVLVSWEPFDFGFRKASVDLAESGRRRAGAQVSVTRLQVSIAAADAYLTILAAQQAALAAQAGVERARVLDQVVSVLVKSELRPGAEAARAKAELALAETQLIRAQQAVEEGRAALGQLLGLPAASLAITPGPLLMAPAGADARESQSAAAHPLALAQSAAVDEVKAREKTLDRTYFPRFQLLGTAYGRGTGVQPDGATGNAVSGMGPNIQNWGLGMSVTFNPFERSSIRARKEAEQARERSETARYNQILQDVNGQVERARAALSGARRVAMNVPIQLEAARAAEQQATARYKAGLGAIVEVAEAQRLLTQAEIDSNLAALGVWRALLGAAAAAGDLSAFLSEAGR